MSFFRKISKINLRSIILNFYLLPLNQAIHLPILIEKNVKIQVHRGSIVLNGSVYTGMLQVGYNTVGTIDSRRDKSILQIYKGGKLICSGKTVRFGAGSNISIGENGCIKCIGEFNVSARSTFIVHRMLNIGNNVLISWDCLFMDTDFHKITSVGNIINAPEEITVGDNVWIGCRCTVLKGAVISSGSIIAAGSLINKKFFTENVILAGVPAKIVKHNIVWER